MIKAIRANFFLSEQQKKIEEAKINRTHDFIPERSLKNVLKMMHNPKTKNQLLNILFKKMHSTDLTLRVKSLVAFHACLREKMDEDFIDVIMNEEISAPAAKKNKADKVTTEFNSYIKQNVIDYYIVYLKKLVMHKQSYKFVKEVAESSVTVALKRSSTMQLIQHGFKILNISNYILNSQQMFNKMGRYHVEFNEILNLYIQLLSDLNFHNSYLKKTVEYLIKDNTSRENFRVQRSLEKISVNGQGLSEMQLSESQIQEVKHMFLYIYETQKLSDKLYQYYHNRYYYRTLRKLIIFPSFLQISPKQYSLLRNKAKRVDKDLVKLVKISKYQGGQRYHTQNPMNQTTMGFKSQLKLKTYMQDFQNTEVTDAQTYKQKSKHYQNATVDFIEIPTKQRKKHFSIDEQYIQEEEVEDL